jgi:hypothetical protein
MKLISGVQEVLDGVRQEAMNIIEEYAASSSPPDAHLTPDQRQAILRQLQAVLMSKDSTQFFLFHSYNGSIFRLFEGTPLIRLIDQMVHSPIGGFSFSLTELLRTFAPLWDQYGHINPKSRQAASTSPSSVDFRGGGHKLIMFLQVEVRHYVAFVLS